MSTRPACGASRRGLFPARPGVASDDETGVDATALRNNHPKRVLAGLDVGEVLAEAGCVVGEMVGLGVVLAGNAPDGKLQRASQLKADPVQRIQPRTAAGILSTHP